jgi:hypothetical protein
MKNPKAPGPGGISVKLISHKNPSETVYWKLEFIFNKCLTEKCEIPTECKMAFLTPIHKK